MAGNPNVDQMPRHLLRELRSGNLEKSAYYLSRMIDTHLGRYPTSEDMLTIFISAHVVMALDVTGFLEVMEGVPIEPLIQVEVHRFMTQFREDPEGSQILARRVLERISAFSRKDPFHGGVHLPDRPEEDTHAGLVNAVCAYLEHHCSDPEVSVNYTAEHFGISPSYLSRVFHSSTGVKLGDYILLLRFDRAKTLLRTTDLSVSQVAQQCGFASCSAFIRSFRTKEGITPGDYRRRQNLEVRADLPLIE